MKTKFLPLLLLLVVLFSNANAQQTTPKLSIGIDGGVALGSVTSAFVGAGGINLKLELPVAHSPLSVILTTGYTFYTQQSGYEVDFGYGYGGYESFGGSGVVAAFVPIEAGARLHIGNRFFIEGDLGASINVNTYSQDFTGNKTAFIYTPVLGYSTPVGFSRRSAIELSLKYENRSDSFGYPHYQQLSFGIAYAFGL